MPIVTINPSGQQVWLEPGETILAGLYKAGYAYAIGCRRGGCGVCKVDAVEGEFTYNRPVAGTVVSEQEHADGACLTCRAVPDGDLTIEFRDCSLRIVNTLLHQINQSTRTRATEATTPSCSPRTTTKE